MTKLFSFKARQLTFRAGYLSYSSKETLSLKFSSSSHKRERKKGHKGGGKQTPLLVLLDCVIVSENLLPVRFWYAHYLRLPRIITSVYHTQWYLYCSTSRCRGRLRLRLFEQRGTTTTVGRYW